MAVTLLRVLVLGAIAAAADDVSITWWPTGRASLACVVPASERLQPRRPPPPLEADDKPRAKPYLWWREDEEITSRILVNGTLEVSRKKDGSTEGLYQCAARHHSGLVLGYPVNLKFAYIDKFSVHPENATAWSGQPFVLSCDISSGPAASISWHRNGVPLPADSRYHVLNNQLLITHVKSEDAGLYRCKATNQLLNKTKFSHGGRLQVQELQGELDVALLPLNFSSVAVPRGSTVELPCPVTGWPRPELIWKFSRAGQRTSELEDTSEVLTLRQLDSSEGGVYTCSVEWHDDIIKSFNVTVTEPVVITVPPTSKQALRASTVRFNCTAVGSPAPNVTWYKDGYPLELTGRKVVLPSTDRSRLELLIRSVISEDAGVYQCFASNGQSSASAWATLDVTGGDAGAPRAVACWPLAARAVRVRWAPVLSDVMAYTVHVTKLGATSLPGQPVKHTDETISVAEPLTPYGFQVRVYLHSNATNRTVASDMSESVTCEGQGVPIKLARFGDDSIFVTWKQFADQNPGVVEWILQYRLENTTEVQNVTIDGKVLNHTLNVSTEGPVLIRVLGTRSIPWLHQNLTYLPWTSSAAATEGFDDGEVLPIPRELEVSELGSRDVTLRWRCDEADTATYLYTYMVCLRSVDGLDECSESHGRSVTVENLQPSSEYMVRVKVIGGKSSGGFSAPVHISTKSEGPQRFRDLKYKYINATTLRVSWNSIPDKYTVHYSSELKLPIDQWDSVDTMGNTVLITGLNLTTMLYVMVTGYEPIGHSSIMTIPAQQAISAAPGLQYSVRSDGIQVSWAGRGQRVVRYSQNLSLPIDRWRLLHVPADINTVHISGLDSKLPIHVYVTPPGPNQQTLVLNLDPRPTEESLFYVWVGVSCGVIILCLLAVAAICLWRRVKRSRTPLRARRRNVSPSEGNEEEGAEMRTVGGRLANGGGPKEAGEPLLNGHVHITENPTQNKTPNGRVRQGQQYEIAFDVARYEDPDTTLETVLDADSSACTTFNLLDTSRRPEYDVSRSSHDISTNNSFNKLPDDNMNSELTRSTDFQLDNSKILPTLQPNG